MADENTGVETNATNDLPTVVEGGSSGAERSPNEHVQIGRYRMLRSLGAGGMGVVYLAYDVDLDRRVAIKLLQGAKGPDSTEGRSRLLREAQAMAKLSHPNVVPVFEVGEHADEVFVAMEFIPGQTLREWMAQRRPWREVIDIFVQAGRGLAAAHARDLVHRDFKPANVLIGEDGRVRVLDFGLARSVVENDPDLFRSRALELSGDHEDADGGAAPSGGLLGTPLTEAGVAMGTPAYMAPEQHFQATVDGRTDQFAFCVALWEALYGQRPFSGKSIRALAKAKLQGELTPPPADVKVPKRIRAAVTRGLAGSAEERWPSMEQLLEALSRDPGATRRRWLTVTALLGAAILAGYAGMRPDDKCRGAEAKLAGIWDEPTRERVERALLATELPYADATWEGVSTVFDDYAESWRTAYRDACEATHVRGEQSDEMLDKRMACLDRRLTEMAALSEVFAATNADTLEHAVEASLRLPPISRCANTQLLANQLEPEDPTIVEQVAKVRAQIAATRARVRAGHIEEAARVGQGMIEAADRTEFDPVRAEARLAEARRLQAEGEWQDAETKLLDAYWIGGGGVHDELAADAAIELTAIVGDKLARADEGMRWAEHARMDLRRIGDDDRRRADLRDRSGGVLLRAGKFDEAKQSYEAALEIRGTDASSVDPANAHTFNGLGAVALQQGDLENAEQRFRAGIELREKVLGATHPDVAALLNNLSMVLRMSGDTRAAQEAALRAVSIYEATVGPEHPNTATALDSVGTAFSVAGDQARAEEYLRRSLAVRQTSLGDEHPLVAKSMNNLAQVLHQLGREDEALQLQLDAFERGQKALGAEHPFVAAVAANLAGSYNRAGDHERARRMAQTAVDIHTKVVGAEHVHTASSLFELGRAQSGLGEFEAAIETYERAAAAYENAGKSEELEDVRRELAAARDRKP